MLVPGTTIGTYRVVKKLGEGGMGTVYLGEHTLLGRPAAIKVLLPQLSTNEEVVKRFFNEARAVTRIADPGIVQVFDFGHHPEAGAFIVMELLEGESMDRRLKRIGVFGSLAALRLMRLICTSLGTAHAKGIIHRDLKPENIFIVQDPGVPGGERAKILDFGIAKLTGNEPDKLKTRTGTVMGTPMYMSPEQCSGGGTIDHRSDIYSIACVMFAMLTGRPPFDGAGAGDLIASHLREPPPLAASRVSDLPGAVDDILQRCLRKSPAERFQSMPELVHALAAVEQTLSGACAVIHTAGPSGALVPPPLSAMAELAATLEPDASIPTQPSAWAGTNLSNPTTLGNATGQAAARSQARSSGPHGRRWIAGAITAAVVVGVAAAIIPQLGGRDVAVPPSAIHAAPASSPPPPLSPPPVGEIAGASVALDGGVPDAPSPAPAVDAAVDAWIAPPRRRPGNSGPHRQTTGRDHEGSAGSAAPPHIDRSD